MKYIYNIVFVVFGLLIITHTADAKVISDSGKPNIMITSPLSVEVKRNTELKWTWTTLKDTPKVDIYLVSGNKKYTFAKSYPNGQNFWWATGYSYTEWKKELKNGTYTIAVCPSGTKKIDQSCGTFDLKMYGDVPKIKVLTPKGGQNFSEGEEIQITFSGAKIGEKYEFLLWYPAKVSPIEFNLGEMIADVKGKESFIATVPEDLKKGVYTIAIIQKTNEGTCLNTCAQTESKPIRIK